jgi:hypothetical protein
MDIEKSESPGAARLQIRNRSRRAGPKKGSVSRISDLRRLSKQDEDPPILGAPDLAGYHVKLGGFQ